VSDAQLQGAYERASTVRCSVAASTVRCSVASVARRITEGSIASDAQLQAVTTSTHQIRCACAPVHKTLSFRTLQCACAWGVVFAVCVCVCVGGCVYVCVCVCLPAFACLFLSSSLSLSLRCLQVLWWRRRRRHDIGLVE